MPRESAIAHGIMDLGPEYYSDLSQEFLRKRSKLCAALATAGLAPVVPQGTYYVLADLTKVGCRETAAGKKQ